MNISKSFLFSVSVIVAVSSDHDARGMLPSGNPSDFFSQDAGGSYSASGSFVPTAPLAHNQALIGGNRGMPPLVVHGAQRRGLPPVPLTPIIPRSTLSSSEDSDSDEEGAGTLASAVRRSNPRARVDDEAEKYVSWAQQSTEEELAADAVASMPLYPANDAYWYDHEDIQTLINLRLQQLDRQDVVVFTPLHPTEGQGVLAEQLVQFRQQHPTVNHILIPYNPTFNHWVGLYLRRQGKCWRAFYVDPLRGDVPQEVQDVIAAQFNGIRVERIKGRKQTDDSSCGPLTVENLISLVHGRVRQVTILDATSIRERHMHLMAQAGHADFALRQYYNRHYTPFTLDVFGASLSGRAIVLPRHLTIDHKDSEKLKAIIAKLHRMEEDVARHLAGDILVEWDRDIVVEFSTFLNEIDRANLGPLSFPLEMQYKEVPWHLVHLHMPQAMRHLSDGILSHVVEELVETKNKRGENGITSLRVLFEKILNLQEVDDNDLLGIRVIIPLWEARYREAVAKDLSRRLGSILTGWSAGNGLLPPGLIMAVLRWTQVAGEYLGNLEHIPSFKKLYEGLELQGFRHTLSHLRNIEDVFEQLYNHTDIAWDTLRTELETIKSYFDVIHAEEVSARQENQKQQEEGKPTETAQERWQRIKNMSQGVPSSPQINTDEWKKLRSTLSAYLQKRTLAKASLTARKVGELVDYLLPYSAAAREAIDRIHKHDVAAEAAEVERQERENNRQALKAAFFTNKKKPEERVQEVLQLVATRGSLVTDEEQKDIEAILNPPASTQDPSTSTQDPPALIKNKHRPHKDIINLVDRLLPSIPPAPDRRWEGIEPQVREEIEALAVRFKREEMIKFLTSYGFDPAAPQYEEFGTFLHGRSGDRSGFFRKFELFASESDYWQERPGMMEGIFACLSGRPLESQEGKVRARLDEINKALALLEWMRAKLGLSEITFQKELSDERNRQPVLARQVFPQSVVTNPTHFNQVRLPNIEAKLDKQIEEHPYAVAQMELMLAMAYEDFQNLFRFPEVASHFGLRTQLRNYHDHPDPAMRTPLLMRMPDGSIPLSHPSIVISPDHDKGHQKVVVQEIVRLFVTFHHVLMVLSAKLNESLPGEGPSQ